MEPLIEELQLVLDTHLDWIEKALARVPEDALWKRLRDGTNSIGNLCLHLAGNERHYVGWGVGGVPYERDRPSEFNTSDGPGVDALLKGLRDARQTTYGVLEKLGAADFDRALNIDHPEYPTVLRVLLHVVEHYAYHTGQIVLMARFFQSGGERILPWGH